VWSFVLVTDVVKDVFFARYRKWRLEVVQWPDGVLVEGEALLQGMSSHSLVEDVAASEVEDAAVILIFGKEPETKN